MLADSTPYQKLQNPTSIQYLPTIDGQSMQQRFHSWSKTTEMVTGVFTLNDYDYESPGKNLIAKADYNYQFQHGNMELYKYIGDYDQRNEGVKLADVLRDVERTRNERCSAFGYAPSLTPGYAITRSAATDDGENGDYVLLRCSHSYGYQTYVSSSSGGGGGATYVGSYELAKSDVPYKIPQRTRKPFIPGTQSALVVGKEGEEIDVDEQGRILRAVLLGSQEEGVAPRSRRAILGRQAIAARCSCRASATKC